MDDPQQGNGRSSHATHLQTQPRGAALPLQQAQGGVLSHALHLRQACRAKTRDAFFGLTLAASLGPWAEPEAALEADAQNKDKGRSSEEGLTLAASSRLWA